ncbi:MAG: 2-oxo acid dehydrogenase subunit E2 [Polyangiales bacterium]
MAPSNAGGSFKLIRPSLHRQFTADAFAALPEPHLMVAMVELDVTSAVQAIAAKQAKGERLSFFAFVVRCIAVAMAEHPKLNTVRHGRSVVQFDDVDISVPVEVDEAGERQPREIVLRRAQDLTVEKVYEELSQGRKRHASGGELGREDHWNRRLFRLLSWLPRFVRVALFRWMIADAFRIKARAGTTIVTSVGKFAALPGTGFTFTTGPRAATFVVGAAVKKPWVHEGQIVARDILSLSLMLDHDMIDGGDAARFAVRLAALIEGAHGLVDERTDPAR